MGQKQKHVKLAQILNEKEVYSGYRQKRNERQPVLEKGLSPAVLNIDFSDFGEKLLCHSNFLSLYVDQETLHNKIRYYNIQIILT